MLKKFKKIRKKIWEFSQKNSKNISEKHSNKCWKKKQKNFKMLEKIEILTFFVFKNAN